MRGLRLPKDPNELVRLCVEQQYVSCEPAKPSPFPKQQPEFPSDTRTHIHCRPHVWPVKPPQKEHKTQVRVLGAHAQGIQWTLKMHVLFIKQFTDEGKVAARLKEP